MESLRKLLVVTLLFSFGQSYAQDSPVLQNDTISYKGKVFFVGQELKLASGSNSNKDFVFIWLGSGMNGYTQLSAQWAKSSIKVDKVYKQKGKFFVRGKAIDAGPLLGAKVLVDVELAVDNTEI